MNESYCFYSKYHYKVTFIFSKATLLNEFPLHVSLLSPHQWRVRSREDGEHQAHAAVPGCSERTALLDRAADPGSKPHPGGYGQKV